MNLIFKKYFLINLTKNNWQIFFVFKTKNEKKKIEDFENFNFVRLNLGKMGLHKKNWNMFYQN